MTEQSKKQDVGGSAPATKRATPPQSQGSSVGDVVVAKVEDIPPGTMKLFNLGRYGIGVYNVDGTFHALANHCPHRGAPLCRGEIRGLVVAGDKPYEEHYIRKGEILRCPWHGWEFEIQNGKASMFDTIKARTYRVSVEGGNITIHGVRTHAARQ